MVYLPLGVGIVIPPWNFPLAILLGMTTAALVTGNTVVIKPSSDTPTIAAKFAEVLLEAGFPPHSFSLLVGSGAESATCWSRTRRRASCLSRDRAMSACASMSWRRNISRDRSGSSAWSPRWAARTPSSSIARPTSTRPSRASPFGIRLPGAEVLGLFARHRGRGDLRRVRRQAEGPSRADEGRADRRSGYYMGPVINDRARQSILDYVEVGKKEGRLVTGGAPAEGEGYFIQPTVIADIGPKARIFQEEIFGPVLAVTKAKDFEEALKFANDSEYGLTGAVYSENPEKLEQARKRFHVGNLYINRKCTGAMVGAHPFGGFNMSGTDSKAGGPDYLLQFLQAKSIAEKV